MHLNTAKTFASPVGICHNPGRSLQRDTSGRGVRAAVPRNLAGVPKVFVVTNADHFLKDRHGEFESDDGYGFASGDLICRTSGTVHSC